MTTPQLPFRIQNSEFRIRRGFTLIEMLVVVAIIAILLATLVTIGTGVRVNANRRSTLAELKLLSGAMKDYLAAGNPEPQVPVVAASANGWYYGNLAYPPNYEYVVPEEYFRTAVPSDPYNWVIALNSYPETAKKIAGLPSKLDTSVYSMISPLTPHTMILDSFGTPIRYVPSSGTTPGYFVSAGPDERFSNALHNNGSANLLHGSTATIAADEIYSTDPQ